MEFFAVTTTSVYLVKDEKDEEGIPIIEKIVLRGESKISVGQRLKNGRYVGITPCGIILYDEDHPRGIERSPQKPEEVNIAFYGGKTTPIIALFLSKDKATTCLDSEDLEPSDSRWENETREVLNSIGNNHPVLIISYWSPDLSQFHFPEN
ncbi:MAG TPA: hypothetical protein ENI19_03185 [Candidatus Nealsonbacteria bacterium]|uniref:Uncharacterized protein n=1 Tax=marine sediment metagenome TaxID=412755 RepID=A0A0F9YE11_9ZZZZ|nr:hypothetical protein [Candidatus Nealsonbacteria bacterium]HEB46683.1 hypothetical protein [Candidatus Nealsonbacteria bacterium]